MYRHQRLTRVRDQAAEIIRIFFPDFRVPELMPENGPRRGEIGSDEARRARLVCD